MSESLITMILYLWGRRNHAVQVGFLGVIPLRAPYICFFFLFLDFMLNHMVIDQIFGIFVGHVFYFFRFIYPKLPLSKDKKPFETPEFL
jgi:Derlin-2/3